MYALYNFCRTGHKTWCFHVWGLVFPHLSCLLTAFTPSMLVPFMSAWLLLHSCYLLVIKGLCSNCDKKIISLDLSSWICSKTVKGFPTLLIIVAPMPFSLYIIHFTKPLCLLSTDLLPLMPLILANISNSLLKSQGCKY